MVVEGSGDKEEEGCWGSKEDEVQSSSLCLPLVVVVVEWGGAASFSGFRYSPFSFFFNTNLCFFVWTMLCFLVL